MLGAISKALQRIITEVKTGKRPRPSKFSDLEGGN